ncbi:entry exclusion protein 1, partial [Klebsiella pneumoniae]
KPETAETPAGTSRRWWQWGKR